MSPKAKAAAANLKLLHPGWEHLYFDDGDIRRFVSAEFPQYQAVFDGFPRTIQRIDFFRYLAVFRFGGFYFDLDVFLSESLSRLLDCGCVFPFEELTANRFLRSVCNIDWEIGNYAFGAAPGHPFLGAVIENCVRGQKEPEWVRPIMSGIPGFFRTDFEVLNTTGPGLLTRTLVECPGFSRDVSVLFPNDVCDSANWHLFGDYGAHLMDGSWRKGGSYLNRRLLCWWEARIRKSFLPESRKRGPKRSWPITEHSDGEVSFKVASA